MVSQIAEPPAWESDKGAAWTLSRIDEWLASNALRNLAATFDGPVPDGSGSEWAAQLDAFAAAKWDFRRGSERDTATRVTLTPTQDEAAIEAAIALGLTAARPPKRDRYDAVLMLGGLVRACIVRPRYAAQLVGSGLKAREFVGLTAFRRLSEGEVAIAAGLGLTVDGEYEAMTDGVKLAFQSLIDGDPDVRGHDVPDDPYSSWRIMTWNPLVGQGGLGDDATVSVAAAPSSEPSSRRANTADTYSYWVEKMRRPSTRSVLVITNPVYVVYQGCTAIQELGIKHGFDTETVGVSAEAADLGDLTQVWTAQDYLQEIRASISSMVRLRAALAALA